MTTICVNKTKRSTLKCFTVKRLKNNFSIKTQNTQLMGHTTEFTGYFRLDKPLLPKHREYLQRFSETRRLARNPSELLPDPIREAAGLPPGFQGAFCVLDDDDSSNPPPITQPGLWCNWRPNAEGTLIEWNGMEKFCEYGTWIKYVVANFLRPWGYVLTGIVRWVGEGPKDSGFIIVCDSRVDLSSRNHTALMNVTERNLASMTGATIVSQYVTKALERPVLNQRLEKFDQTIFLSTQLYGKGSCPPFMCVLNISESQYNAMNPTGQ